MMAVAGNAADLTVFAAASLTDGLKEIGANYAQETGQKVVFNFEASSVLARQIMAGAPPLVENLRTVKATRIACEEVSSGLIEYDFTEPGSDEEKESVKRRR